MRVKLSVFVTLCCVAVMGMVSGAGVEAQQAPGSPAVERTGGEVVGASVAHPAAWHVEREELTFDGTYGFTLWRPDTAEAHDHGGMPALRVALAYDLRPGGIEDVVENRLSELSDLPATRETVGVAREGHEGVAVGPIPGSTPYTEVYVPVNGRVYRIDVYAEGPGKEGLDAEDRELLSDLRFSPPSRSVASLGVPRANAPETLYRGGNPGLVRREEEARAATGGEAETAPESSTLSRAAGGTTETRNADGCWRPSNLFFFQTQHGYGANGSSGDDIPTGYTRVGRPNYWNQYTHGSLGYGRCTSDYYTNDKYAVDYPLDRGNVVFSPFRRGTVTFAGRNSSHKNYGIFVVIRADNGRYVSMSAHLNGLRTGITRGKVVTDKTIIGYAGNSGDPSIPVGEPHLHQAYYRYPSFLNDGSPYGGSGLQVVYHHFIGTAAGTGPGRYQFGWDPSRRIKAKGSLISN